MSWKILKSKVTLAVTGPRSDGLAENNGQFLKRCHKGPVLSGSRRVHIRAVMVDKAKNQALKSPMAK